MILLLLVGLVVSVHGSISASYFGLEDINFVVPDIHKKYPEPLVPRHIHLSISENPAEMVITWSTEGKTTNSFVEYGTDLGLMRFAFGRATPLEECGGGGCRTQYIHRCKLAGLEYNKRYIYHVGSSDGGWSAMFSFNTPPAKPASQWAPRILALGDMGSTNAKAFPYLRDEVGFRAVDLMLHVGDFAYDLDWENGAVGDAFMEELQTVASYVPYMTCPGNHEEKRNFTEYKARFTMPGPYDNLMHSFNMGMVHFIAFSTEFYYFLEYGIKLPVKQYQWLEDDLKQANTPEARAERPWIVAFGHRPMYCSNGGPADCNNYSSRVRTGLPFLGIMGLEDLFYKYGVDVALWGHQHSYERLWPVYNHEVKNGSIEEPYRNPGAPVHIITGSAGCREGKSPFVLPPPAWSAFRSTDYGYTKLIFRNVTHLLIEQVSIDQRGDIIDYIWLIKDEHKSYLPSSDM